MNGSRNGDGFPVTGTGNHGKHVAHPESAVPPPHVADIVDTPSWDCPWIDLGGEG